MNTSACGRSREIWRDCGWSFSHGTSGNRSDAKRSSNERVGVTGRPSTRSAQPRLGGGAGKDSTAASFAVPR